MTTRPTALPPDATTRLRPRRGGRDYFLLRRWTRVFFSSLRCFFLAIRLRRFLITEPMRKPPLRTSLLSWRPSNLSGAARADYFERILPGFDVGVPQVVVNGLLRDPEGTADTYRGQLARVNHPLDRH